MMINYAIVLYGLVGAISGYSMGSPDQKSDIKYNVNFAYTVFGALIGIFIGVQAKFYELIYTPGVSVFANPNTYTIGAFLSLFGMFLLVIVLAYNIFWRRKTWS